MNVDKVNLNISNGAYSRKNGAAKIGFTSNIPQAVIEQEINNLNKPVLQGINKLKHNIGEFQDICINALGTGLLAPVFIKYNPLSKTDEDTRTYSAWRQPLSAVLAILTQGLVTIPVVKVIKNMANRGELGEACNLTPFKDEKYVETMMKKLHPEADKTQLERYVKEYMKGENNDLAYTISTLKKENTVYYNTRNITDKTEKRTKINPERYKNLLNRTVDDMIKEEAKELKRCEEVKTQKRIARSEFYRTNNETSQKLLNEMRDKINSTDNVDDIRSFLKTKEKSLKSSKSSQHLIDMVAETRARAFAGKDAMISKVEKMQGHVNKYKNVTSKEEVIKLVQESVADRVNAHKDAISFLEKVKEGIKNGKTVDQLEAMFTKQSNEAKKAGKKFRLDDKIFSKEVALKLKTLTEKHIEGVKRISTLIAALAILPLSCGLLNWVYPRVMDVLFPNLSSKKHNNESKELVDKATKNSEVK